MTILLKPENSGNISFALQLLESGCPVSLPTETVYGLAASLFDAKAISRVFQMKNRPYFDPLILHVPNLDSLAGLAASISETQKLLIEKFWPGPLTILFKKTDLVPDLATAGGEWVAVRSPQNSVFREILSKLRDPYLVAPSANRFTSVSPTSADDVLHELGPYGLEAVVDGGPSSFGLESTVVQVHEEAGASHLEILRPGAVSREELEATLPKGISIRINPTGTGAKTSSSPGQHHLHYSPGIPLHFFSRMEELEGALSTLPLDQLCLLEVTKGQLGSIASQPWAHRHCLGSDKVEAASNIFRSLRLLKTARISGIVAVAVEESGLGLALNDRLRRAAGKG